MAKIVEQIDLSLLPVAPEGEVCFVEEPSCGEYGGKITVCFGGRQYLIEVIDDGWRVTEPGETNEEGAITHEARGADLLTTRITDLESGNVAEFENLEPDTNVHGAVYAAARMVDPRTSNPEHYRTYLMGVVRDSFHS